MLFALLPLLADLLVLYSALIKRWQPHLPSLVQLIAEISSQQSFKLWHNASQWQNPKGDDSVLPSHFPSVQHSEYPDITQDPTQACLQLKDRDRFGILYCVVQHKMIDTF